MIDAKNIIRCCWTGWATKFAIDISGCWGQEKNAPEFSSAFFIFSHSFPGTFCPLSDVNITRSPYAAAFGMSRMGSRTAVLPTFMGVHAPSRQIGRAHV